MAAALDGREARNVRRRLIVYRSAREATSGAGPSGLTLTTKAADARFVLTPIASDRLGRAPSYRRPIASARCRLGLRAASVLLTFDF